MIFYGARDLDLIDDDPDAAAALRRARTITERTLAGAIVAVFVALGAAVLVATP